MIELSSKIPIAELAVIVLQVVAQSKRSNSVRIPIGSEFNIDLLNAVLAEYGGKVRSNEAKYDEIGLKLWNEIELCPSDFDATQLWEFQMWDKK